MRIISKGIKLPMFLESIAGVECVGHVGHVGSCGRCFNLSCYFHTCRHDA